MKLNVFLTLLLLLAATTASAYNFEVDGIYYYTNGNEAIVTQGSEGYSGEISIPETVTYEGVTYVVTAIDYFAFNSCSDMSSISIPSSVISISESAFFACYGLTSITVESGNPKYDSRDNCNAIIETANNTLILGCQNTMIPNSVTAIGRRAFEGCSTLTSVTIPNSVTSIGNWAFGSCVGLTSVTIPNSVAVIGDNAFAWCSGLTSVTIPRSVTSIGVNPFFDCESLVTIKVDSENPNYDSRDNCNAIIETASNTLVAGCKNAFIPNTVNAIGEYAFARMIEWTSVTIPNSVTTIGDNAFVACHALTNVTIPSSVTSIGSWAFAYCYGLMDVYSYITDLENLTIGESVFAWQYDSWDTSDYSHRTLYVPYGTTADYEDIWSFNYYFGTIVEMNRSGDIDGDGVLRISDVTDLINMLLAGNATVEANPAADVNGDGIINITDVSDLINMLLTR